MNIESVVVKRAKQQMDVDDDRLIKTLEDIAVTIQLEVTRINNLTGSLDIIIDNLKANRKRRN